MFTKVKREERKKVLEFKESTPNRITLNQSYYYRDLCGVVEKGVYSPTWPTKNQHNFL